MADAGRRTSASKLVDELLGRKEFAELWVMKWAELLQIRSSQPGQLQGDAPVLQLAAGARSPSNVPMNEMVQELLGGQRRHVQEPGDELLPDRDATS